jgi:hypothetical protein
MSVPAYLGIRGKQSYCHGVTVERESDTRLEYAATLVIVSFETFQSTRSRHLTTKKNGFVVIWDQLLGVLD